MSEQSAKLVRILSLIGLAFIVGCITSRPTIKQSLTVGPVVKESLIAQPISTIAKSARVAPPPKPAPTKAIFSCDVESSPMAGLYGFFEMRTNNGSWNQVAIFPYDGQTHFWTNWFTNDPVCFVRAGYHLPQ